MIAASIKIWLQQNVVIQFTNVYKSGPIPLRRVSAYGSLKSKGKGSITSPPSVHNGLGEWVNEEFVWELKRGFCTGGHKSCPFTSVR